MRVLKKISYYITIFALALLLSDAYPDFSDNRVADDIETFSSPDVLNHFVYFFATKYIHIKNISDSTFPVNDVHHSIDIDVFIPAPFLEVNSPPEYPYRMLTYHQFAFHQVFIEVIPFPPCTKG